MVRSGLLLLGLAGLVARGVAQDESSQTTMATSTRTSSAVPTHTIAVGAAGFKFSPNEVTAEVGDVIEWVFYPDGHSVVRADFGHPCIPYEYVGIASRAGFFSGPQPVKAYLADGPKFQVTVNDTEPIFFYCGAPGSCWKEKMIGVINPTEEMSLEAQLEVAEDVEFQLIPGDRIPTEEDLHGTTTSSYWSSSTSTSTPSSTSTPAPPTPTSDTSDEDDEDDDDGGGSPAPALSPGAIAGIAIGSAAVLILGIALVYICGRRGGFVEAYRQSVPPPTAANASRPGIVEAKYPSPRSPGAETWSSLGTHKYAAATTTAATDAPRPGSPPLTYDVRSPLSPPFNATSFAAAYSGNEGGATNYESRSARATPPPGADQGPVELPSMAVDVNRQFSWAEGQERIARSGGAP